MRTRTSAPSSAARPRANDQLDSLPAGGPALWPPILQGLGNTLLLAVIITFNGLLGGILVFYLTLSPRSVVRRLTDGYISFFIGTPLIVLLFLMYYGLPQWGLPLSP
jgi:polar amino acid transport system permease protein